MSQLAPLQFYTEVLLKNTIFTFGKKALTQKLGTVIGAKFAPPHSNFIYGRTGRKCNERILNINLIYGGGTLMTYFSYRNMVRKN